MNITFYIFLILTAFLGFFLSFHTSDEISLPIFLTFVSFSGILLASYLFYKKRSDTELLCPIGSNCKEVIHSEYSKFLGVPIEFGGALYYAIIFAIYTALIVSPGSVPVWVIFGAMGLSAAAFLFSIYLTFIQAFVLKQWCCWCLLSAVFSSIIFLVSLGSLEATISFLLEIKLYLEALHLLGISLGVGGVTIISILFFRFLRDFRISQWEAGVLKMVSQVVWIALTLLILSELALYLPHMEKLHSMPSFLVEMFAILVIVLSRVMLNLIIAPCMIAASLEKDSDDNSDKLCRLRKNAFVWSAVSIVSWYFVFVLGVMRDYSFQLLPLLAAYILLLFFAASIGNLVESKLSKNLHNKSEGEI